MAGLGFDQAISWSLEAEDVADRLRLGDDDPRRRSIRVANPISSDQVLMRTTLLAGLLASARHNVARDVDEVRLFETGRAYLPEMAPADGGVEAGEFPGDEPAPDREPLRLAAVLAGPLGGASWRGTGTPGDFYAIKGVVEELAADLGVEAGFESATEPFLHPGRAASVSFAGVAAGWLGEVHPGVAAAWDLPDASAFELDLAPLFAAASAGESVYEDVTTHPALRQDLAVVVAEDVPARAVIDAVRAGGGDLLREVRVFDLYHGEQVGEGHKSLALRLEFRAPDRTLTDEEVEPLREAIRAKLDAIGGGLRE